MMARFCSTRGGSGKSEIVKGVEDAHAEGGESGEEKVRKDDAIQSDGFLPTAGAVLRGGEGLNDHGREDDAENGNDRENQSEGPEETIGEAPKILGGRVAHVGGKNRDEGGGDHAVADQTAKEVGKAVGEDESVGRKGGAEEEGDALVPNVTENPADDGNQGDDGGGFEDLLLFGQRWPSGT